eukprot:SAG22_NODE_437_length_10501_cov_3.019804_15_plen_132_part_00
MHPCTVTLADVPLQRTTEYDKNLVVSPLAPTRSLLRRIIRIAGCQHREHPKDTPEPCVLKLQAKNLPVIMSPFASTHRTSKPPVDLSTTDAASSPTIERLFLTVRTAIRPYYSTPVLNRSNDGDLSPAHCP